MATPGIPVPRLIASAAKTVFLSSLTSITVIPAYRTKDILFSFGMLFFFFQEHLLFFNVLTLFEMRNVVCYFPLHYFIILHEFIIFFWFFFFFGHFFLL
jgi:hypothetical protein